MAVRYVRCVASHLACIGLGVGSRDEFDDLVSALVGEATSLGHVGRTEVLRWQDPSGARLVFELHGGAVEGVIPGFDALAGADVRDLRALDDDLAVASIAGAAGDEVAQIALEVEERRLMLGRRRTFTGRVSVVGLGVGVELFDDAESFAQAPASLVHGDEAHVPEPSPHVVEFGLPWPPRMAAESLQSYAVFAEPHDRDAYARVNGTVLGASTRTVERTGQSFHAIRVRSVGFELEMCVPTSSHPDLPRTGQVVGGMAYMVASLGHVPERHGRIHLPGRS